LERQRQQQLEQERQRKAVEEAQLRAEAAERERRQRLENLRNKVSSQHQSVVTKIQQQQSSMYPKDATELQERCQNQTNTIRQAQDESHLQNVAAELNQILQDCDQAVTRKRRDDEEKKRKEEIEKLQFELEELEREVGRIPTGDASKFDAVGQKSVQQALVTVRSALASGNPQTVQAPINNASTIVKQHTQIVTQRRAEWEKCKAAAEQVLGKIQDLVTGFKADPVVMRWYSHLIAQLDNELRQAQQAIVSEQFDQPSQILAKIQAQEKLMIEEANIAQLKADKRDYITQSIVATLQDMGFAVLSVTDEYPGHPSTAKVFTATAAGRAISVNVPVEGQVWYDVDGYAKNTAASVADGSPVAICDEAEAKLTEMHSVLQQEFGIQMGEISWQGKDPNRIKGEAEKLPTNANQSRGGNR
jgi:hypothetical protein